MSRSLSLTFSPLSKNEHAIRSSHDSGKADRIKTNLDHNNQMSTTPEQEFFIASWRTLAQAAHDNARDKGFRDTERTIPAWLAEVHGELSEILGAAKLGNPESKKIPGFTQIEEECADVVLRMMDTGEGLGFRIAEALVAKMKYNEGRERLHGKEF